MPGQFEAISRGTTPRLLSVHCLPMLVESRHSCFLFVFRFLQTCPVVLSVVELWPDGHSSGAGTSPVQNSLQVR